MLRFVQRPGDRSYFERPENMPPVLHRLLVQRGITSAAEAEAFLHPSVHDLNDPFLLSDMNVAAGRIRRAERVYRELPFNLSIPAETVGRAGGGNVAVQGIIDLIFEEDGKWVIVDYKSNFITAESRADLVEHYAVQMRLYAKAAEMITRKPVSECILCFLRAGIEEKVIL